METIQAYISKIEAARQYIAAKIREPLQVAIILGSGLAEFAEAVEQPLVINYQDIPNFPVPSVHGHGGRLVIGKKAGLNVAVCQGRVHYYEGRTLAEVVFPTRVLAALGIPILMVTNAAGGVNTNFQAGALMFLRDHLNLMGTNPLIGENMPGYDRFPDMSNAYDQELRTLCKKAATAAGIPYQEGVYAALTGPSYETPAEIRMMRTLGADAVGMSTVPEVIVANHLRMKVIGISCITNMAAGILDQKLSHEEVMETGQRVKSPFVNLLNTSLQALAQSYFGR
jgi:purine-nucleoside phosphorylase